MLRTIVLAVDETPAARVARDLAIGLAKRKRASITGIGVIDRPWATAPRATPIGGGAYKEHRDRKVLDDLRREVETILAGFAGACGEAGVPCATVVAEDAPAHAITSEAEASDLIVVGRSTNFHFEPEPDMTEMVARLIRDNARPVLITSAQEPAGNKALVCYDGSTQSSRAMHMFILLGLAELFEVHLVSVAPSRDAADGHLERARKLFQTHDVPLNLHGVVSDADAGEVILAEVEALRPQLMVMGAFGHRGLRELFLGSATRTLLSGCEAGILIHH